MKAKTTKLRLRLKKDPSLIIIKVIIKIDVTDMPCNATYFEYLIKRPMQLCYVKNTNNKVLEGKYSDDVSF